MEQEIFISYSRDDKALVHPFVDEISKAVEKFLFRVTSTILTSVMRNKS